jgi:hypothetical protein
MLMPVFIAVLALPLPATPQDLTRVLEGDQFVLRYPQNLAEAEAQKVFGIVQKQYFRLNEALKVSPEATFEVRVYTTVGAYLQESGSKAAWRGAYYNRGVIHVQVTGDAAQQRELESWLTHEVARLFLEPSVQHGCPLWLRESYAVYVSGQASRLTPPAGVRITSFSDLMQEMQAKTEPPRRDDVVYLLDFTCRHLIRSYGQPKVLRMFKMFDGTKTVDQVFALALAKDYAAVESGWAAALAKASPQPPPGK